MNSKISKNNKITVKEKADNLIKEKSFLQLIISMMQKIGIVSGLENTVESLIHAIIEGIGGVNVTLYYLVKKETFVYDIQHKKNKIDIITDQDIKKVFDTQKLIEKEDDHKSTRTHKSKLQKTYTLVYPLLVENKIIGVIKIENLQYAIKEFESEFQAFLNYAAILLKNDIYRFTHLKNIKNNFVNVQKLNEKLLDKNIEYTALNEEYMAVNEELNQTNDELISLNEKVRQSEKKYRTLVENINIGIFHSRLDGSFFFANSMIAKMAGYDHVDEFLKIPAENLYVKKSDREDIIKELQEKGFVKNKEIHSRKKSGEVYWISMNAIYLKGPSGKPISILGSIEDITKRKRAEEALFNERKLFMSGPTVIFKWIAKEGWPVDYVSPNILDQFGYTQKDFTSGKIPYASIVHPDDLERVAAEVSYYSEKGIHSFEQTYRIANSHGLYRWILDYTTVERGQDNTINFYHGYIIDNTEHKLAEEALRDSENIQRTILRGSPIPQFVIDKNHKVIQWNEALEIYSGILEKEVIGTNHHWKAFYTEERPCMVDLLIDGQIDKITQYYEGKCFKSSFIKDAYEAISFFPHIGPLGTWFHFTAACLRDLEGNIVGALETLEDVSMRELTENALRKSEEKYRSIIETAYEGVMAIDKESKVTFVNPRTLEILGYHADEIIGQKFENFLLPEELKDHKNQMQRRREGKASSYERRFLHKNGKIVWCFVSASPIFDENNQFKGSFGMLTDITDRKQATELLTESEERNRALINANPDQMFVISKDYLFLDYKSKRPGDTLVPPEGFIGKRIVDVLPKNISELTLMHIDLLFKTGKDQLFEYSLMFKEERRFYESRLVKLGTDKVLALIRDISEQKITENALKYSENQFRSIWEKSKDGMRLIDEKGNIVMVNEAFCQLFEKEKQELIHHSFEIVYASHSKDQIFDSFIRKISKDSFDDILEKEYELWNNKKKWLQISSTIITKEDGSKQVLSIFRDITFRFQNELLHRELKIAESTTQIKQKFLADMSHEIRTPLSGIIGMTEILSGTTLDDVQKDYLDSIKVSSENLLYIINDILDLSKIEAGKMELLPANIIFEQFKNKFYGTFIGLKKGKPLNLIIESSEEFPKQIYADEKRLTQVINNLLSNAVKFTIEGSIKISFSVVQLFSNEQAKLKVEVTDTGIGIKKADQEKLFAKFSQVNSVLSGAYEGSGLGLLICKELIQMMNGEIHVISEEKKGSTFWFTFTAGIPNELPESTEKTRRTQENKIYANVLVVEDTFINRKIASIMLEKIGCKVVMAENGVQALEVFEEGKFDMILMDIQMPVMDGITASKELRKKFKNIPVIVGLSAFAMEGDAEKYIHLGLDDYVIKPVTAEKLYELLKKWIKD